MQAFPLHAWPVHYTHNLQSFQVEEQDWKLDDLVDVISRVLLLTGGLKVEHTEVVQGIGISLPLVHQVTRRRRLTDDSLPPHVLLQSLAKHGISPSETTTQEQIMFSKSLSMHVYALAEVCWASASV